MYVLYSALLAASRCGLPLIFQMARHGSTRGVERRLGRVPQRILIPTADRRFGACGFRGRSFSRAGMVAHCARNSRASRGSFDDYASDKNLRGRGSEQNVFTSARLGFVYALLPGAPHGISRDGRDGIWPIFCGCRGQWSKVAVVNARISDRSLPGYLRFEDGCVQF